MISQTFRAITTLFQIPRLVDDLEINFVSSGVELLGERLD